MHGVHVVDLFIPFIDGRRIFRVGCLVLTGEGLGCRGALAGGSASEVLQHLLMIGVQSREAVFVDWLDRFPDRLVDRARDVSGRISLR